MHKLAIAILIGLVSTAVLATTPEQEKQFIDTYKKAADAKDTKTLNSLLYTKGADPQALEFYKMMMMGDPNSKITSITLEPMSAADKTRVAKPMPGPGGKNLVLTVQPTKKLMVRSASKSKDGSSSGTSEVYVAEVDGKLVIPVPGPAK